MERCIFCGATRKSTPNLRFFGLPREPGLKRIQWLYVLGDKDIGQKDRVCAMHFRQGKPSSDPSHEDFVPHLHLKKGITDKTLSYLESLDNAKESDSISEKRTTPSILKKRIVHKKFSKKVQNVHDGKANTTAIENSPILISIPNFMSEAVKIEDGQDVIIKQYKIFENF